jgi:DNA-3-methyladenine glycosylase II
MAEIGYEMTEIGRIIKSDACVEEGAAFLAALDPRFEMALRQIGTLPLRLKDDGFTALLDAIVGQQISVAAANGIWTRMKDANLIEQDAIRVATDDELRAVGLSRPKVKYVRSLAEHSLNYRLLRRKDNVEVLRELTSILGIGTWTAQIYALSSLGRADIFPNGDLALQESARVLFDLDARPNEKQMAVMAADWAPWRAVAARLLWAYYRVIKNREGITK